MDTLVADSTGFIHYVSAHHEIFGNFAQILSAVASIFNIGVVVYLFFASRRIEKRVSQAATKALWFREVAIKPNLERIDHFYICAEKQIADGILEMLNKITNNASHAALLQESRSMISTFTEARVSLRKEFIDIIDALDNNLANDIYLHFDGLEDKITEGVDEILTKGHLGSFEPQEIFRQHRIDLLRKLIRYDTK